MNDKPVSNSVNPAIISKAELAEILQISPRILAIWLNELHYEELKRIGYNKYQHLITRAYLDIVFPWGIY